MSLCMLIIIFSDQVCYTLLEMNCDFVLTIHQRDFNPARAKQVKVGLPPIGYYEACVLNAKSIYCLLLR